MRVLAELLVGRTRSARTRRSRSLFGSMPSRYRWKKAGSSFRLVRSPEAPKITIGLRRECVPRRGHDRGLLRFHGVAAELVAERRDDLRAEGLVLPRREPREERQRRDRRGHVLVDAPPATSSAPRRSRPRSRGCRRAPGRSRSASCRSSKQPRPHDAAVPPDAQRSRSQVEVERRLLHDLEPFAVRGEQAVLDPVVDHLHEVACARAARRARTRPPARAPGTPARRRRRRSGSPPTIRQ